MGLQIQLFTAASGIFFGDKSILSTSLRQLLINVGQNKKSLCDQIAIDDFFPLKFLFAIDKRIQPWLRTYE
jgi:hypothetical protein